MQEPTSPRLFLVDGYALIYRAFYALISRPLRTGKGENTSAVWGIANFLQRMVQKHNPEYLGWVHDSGLSFRHETYPEYKATREKLTDELQADFDTGIERVEQLLGAYGIPIIALDGYEADDVIGTLARQGAEASLNTVIISGDKDFQQLVREHVWLLNPGRGGPAAVEEHWVSVENAAERLGVPPERVIDYLALIGDTSDNVPGVPGIGGKTAIELITQYGDLEQIIAHAGEITKKRPREALLANIDKARLSRDLVTIRDQLDIKLDLDQLRVKEPDRQKLRALYVELEFHSLARGVEDAPAQSGATGGSEGAVAVVAAPMVRQGPPPNYRVIDTLDGVAALVARAREVGTIAVDTETVLVSGAPDVVDPLRTRLVSISIAIAPGESYYLPLAHRSLADVQEELDVFSSASIGASAGGGASSLGAEGRDAGTDIGITADRGSGDAGAAGAIAPAAPATARKKSAVRQAAPAFMSIAQRVLAEEGGKIPIINLPPLMSDGMTALRQLLEDPAVGKIGQNIKYDMLVLRRAGVNLRGLVADTMIASYLLDPGRRSYGLDLLALEFTGHRMTTYDELCGKGKDAMPFDRAPISAARDYSCEDADMALRLWEIFRPQLDAQGVSTLFREVEIPLIPVLCEMEWTGISIDVTWFRSLKERFGKERERIAREIHELAGGEFNINSNHQLREILFVKLGLPVLKKTATGASTDASVLQQFADQGHPLPALILEYRELAKLENTYLDALPALVNPDTGRLHTSFNQTVASTGRLSSSDPNLQNIPNRRELGRDIRRGFVPRAGCHLMAADYSQIELRLLAHMSGDPAFVEAFRAGGDIHRQTASVIFNVPLADVTSTMRARAKTINFATIYGQGAHALSQQLGIEFAEAREFIATYFERFRGVREFLDSRVEYAREHGYVETIFGRRRYIPEIRDRNFNVRAFGERTAANSPIQGSAADLIKIAMIQIDREITGQGFDARMLLQVHDELVFEVPDTELDKIRALVKDRMENAAELSVPLVVDIGVGDNWVTAKSGG